MDSLLAVLIVIFFGLFIYYWRKKNKTKKWIFLLLTILTSVIFTQTPYYKEQSVKNTESQRINSSKKAESKKASLSSQKSKSSSIKKDKEDKSENTNSKSSSEKQRHKSNKISRYFTKKKAEGLKLGTAKNNVIKKIGKPVRNDGQMLTYDDFVLYFENDKLVGGNLPAIQKKVDKKIAKEKEDKKNYESKLKGYAQAFGRKPVDTIQSMPSVYSADRIEDNMVYKWHPEGLPLMFRVDAPNNFTTVYEYDKNGKYGLLGRVLYQGRTIYQKPATQVVYQ